MTERVTEPAWARQKRLTATAASFAADLVLSVLAATTLGSRGLAFAVYAATAAYGLVLLPAEESRPTGVGVLSGGLRAQQQGAALGVASVATSVPQHSPPASPPASPPYVGLSASTV